MKFGVVRFPGSCDEIDALLACRRFGEADLLWHKDRDLVGVDAVIVPASHTATTCGRERSHGSRR
jgi:phosphoribosylformylglycinamidine synthase